MFNKSFILKFLPWGLLLITINSHGQTLELGNTTFWWIVQFFVLLLFFIIKNNFISQAHHKNLLLLEYYVYYVIMQFIYGALISESYWDWKSLVSNTMCLLIPMVAFASNSKLLLRHLFSHYIIFTAPIFILIQFYIGRDEYGFYLAPFSFFILFFPVLTFRWKFVISIIAAYVIFADFGARSNLIKFSVPFLFSFIYYFNKLFTKKIFEFFRLTLLIAPMIFFTLAISGYFNIFNPQGDKKKEIIDKKRDFKGELVEDDLLADTRTFLYIDVLETTIIYNSWILGRSPARGNISDTFGEIDMNKRNERNGNEVAILNYFIWLGLVGVLFIFFLFYQASNLAINHSNNTFSKIIGLFVAFRWAFAWIEDINNFYIQYIYLWLFIGLCFSENFRKMTNKQMIKWVHSIFEINIHSRTTSKAIRATNNL
jgi:hypothetical protein